MAGIDTEYDGLARPLPGASIGYLAQEPELTQPTVQECIDEAVSSSQAILDEYNALSMKLADPDLGGEEMAATMEQLEVIGNKIDAGDLWELDRVVSRAMDSLRVPPGDAKIETLSGGEKRRTALCRLLLQNHDMLLLDEPTNHLDTSSIAWLEVRSDKLFIAVGRAIWIMEEDSGFRKLSKQRILIRMVFVRISEEYLNRLCSLVLCVVSLLLRRVVWMNRNSLTNSKERWFVSLMTGTSSTM
jgi:hypothetical protein